MPAGWDIAQPVGAKTFSGKHEPVRSRQVLPHRRSLSSCFLNGWNSDQLLQSNLRDGSDGHHHHLDQGLWAVPAAVNSTKRPKRFPVPGLALTHWNYRKKKNSESRLHRQWCFRRSSESCGSSDKGDAQCQKLNNPLAKIGIDVYDCICATDVRRASKTEHAMGHLQGWHFPLSCRMVHQSWQRWPKMYEALRSNPSRSWYGPIMRIMYSIALSTTRFFALDWLKGNFTRNPIVIGKTWKNIMFSIDSWIPFS